MTTYIQPLNGMRAVLLPNLSPIYSMIRKWFYYLKLFLTLTMSVIPLKGFYSFCNQKVLSLKSQLIKSECRIIKHELGESCLTQYPQCIIVTDQESLEILVALGLKTRAETTANRVGNKGYILRKNIDKIIDLGKESQPNIEKIIQLNPDLILDFFISDENYQLFSQIAPTVSINYTETGWKETLLQVAKIL
ncbi:ABC transporter substrate-binding protein [Umezakia ovalisporum]|uniref:ABC transporter substrate-binding protein n=2 Tax=Umezakia ovalisporum TaxID=75695 RepID=UPI0026A2CE9B